MDTAQWFVARGRTKQGPYTTPQMRQMAASGTLQPTDMVLPCGATRWQPAATVPDLLAPAPLPAALASAIMADEPRPLPPELARPDYFINVGGQQRGPFTLAQLQAQGLPPETPVWRQGLVQWTRADDVPEVVQVSPAPTSDSAAWFVTAGGIRQGPLTNAQVRQMAALGHLQPNAMVWHSGLPGWSPVSMTFPDLFPATPIQPPAVPPTELPPQPAPLVREESEPTQAAPSSSSAPPVRQASPVASAVVPGATAPPAVPATDRLASWLRQRIEFAKSFLLDGPQPGESGLVGEQPGPMTLPTYRLHRVGDIVVAAMIGTPLAAFLAIALNYIRLGYAQAARRMGAVGVLWTVAFVPILLFTGRVFPFLVSAASVVAVFFIARHRMGAFLANHQRNDGQAGSGLELLGVCLLAALPLVLVYLAASSDGMGQRIFFGRGEEIYYLGDTRVEAQQLGDNLKQLGVFDGTTGKTVQLSKKGSTWVINFVMAKPGSWDAPDVRGAFWGPLGLCLAARVFPDSPVEIGLCDRGLVVRASATVGPANELKATATDRLLYPTALKSEAERLTRYLIDGGMFDGKQEREIFFSKRDSAWVPAFVVAPQAQAGPQDPRMLDDLRQLARNASTAVFSGQPVEIALLGSGLAIRRVLTSREPLAAEPRKDNEEEE